MCVHLTSGRSLNINCWDFILFLSLKRIEHWDLAICLGIVGKFYYFRTACIMEWISSGKQQMAGTKLLIWTALLYFHTRLCNPETWPLVDRLSLAIVSKFHYFRNCLHNSTDQQWIAANDQFKVAHMNRLFLLKCLYV